MLYIIHVKDVKVVSARLCSVQVVSAEDRAAISAAHARTVTLWRKRKRMASEVLDSILESWQKPKKSLFEDIGIDTDESVGVKMPK